MELGHSTVNAVVAPTDLIGMSIVDFTDVVASLTRAPVFIGLARDDDHADAVAALDRGARGILPMPLDPSRIASEVRALEHASRTDGESPTELRVGHVHLLSLSHRVLVDGVEVHLSPKEFAILEYLMRASPRVVRWRELIDAFESGATEHLTRVRVMIAKLRVRLSDAAPGLPNVVHTIRGIGYRVGD
ncbi:winged helix-turn-helix domain-containing protein [Microcella sp.]|uniref:winged helix-turn-helix domain-containing protein n=1 Tax=Microcella sp. TaxID=1913979 RepID=UPI00299F65CA|nr:winged helix-turn-helix domain-containing protein [Microcella sp.]MDX2026028.1 winged helix-turn-helix domain-containing protein [Microcella sp.]